MQLKRKWSGAEREWRALTWGGLSRQQPPPLREEELGKQCGSGPSRAPGFGITAWGSRLLRVAPSPSHCCAQPQFPHLHPTSPPASSLHTIPSPLPTSRPRPLPGSLHGDAIERPSATILLPQRFKLGWGPWGCVPDTSSTFPALQRQGSERKSVFSSIFSCSGNSCIRTASLQNPLKIPINVYLAPDTSLLPTGFS